MTMTMTMTCWSRVAYRTLSTLATCGRLARQGCRVLEANAHLDPPLIRISPPPAGALPTYGYQSPPGGRVRVPVVCVARLGGARVEWISKEANQ